MKRRNRTVKPKKASSKADLAKIVGKDPGTITRWIQREDWPFSKSGPWGADVVRAIERWATLNLAPNPAADPANAIDSLELPDPSDRASERAAKLKILRERGLKLELERKHAEGDLLPRAEVEQGRLQRIAAVRHAMTLAGPRIAQQIANIREPGQVERIVEDEMRSIANAFAGND